MPANQPCPVPLVVSLLAAMVISAGVIGAVITGRILDRYVR